MKREGSEKPFSQGDYYIAVLFILAILATYILLHGIYRPYNYDDPGFLSFLYNFSTRGIDRDLVFGTTEKTGYSGVVLFGKTGGFLYGTVLEVIGWTRSHSHLISIILIAAAACCWHRFLIGAGFSARFALFFVLLLLLLEPFFGAANQARSDALCFFLSSLVLLLFSKRLHVCAGFFAVVAFEVHPVGIAAFFYILAAAAAGKGIAPEGPWRRIAPLLGLVVGSILGAAYYCLLHADALPLLSGTLRHGNRGGFRLAPILSEYFFKTKYLRHLPELLLIAGSAVIFIIRGSIRRYRTVSLFFAASMLISLVIRRPNFMYMIFIYPGFLLLILTVFETAGRLRLLMAVFLIYLLPQYAVVYFHNRDFDLDRYLTKVTAAVPADRRTVVGNPNDWFAFKDRDFVTLDYRRGIDTLDLEEFYLIEGDDYRAGWYPKTRALVESDYELRTIGQFMERGKTIIIRKARRK